MFDDLSFSLILGSLPAGAALINAIWPTESRARTYSKLRRVVELIDKLPDGLGKDALREAADEMAVSIASIEMKRLQRRLDFSSVGTVVFVIVIAGVVTFVGSLVDHIVMWILVAIIDIFAALLLLVGFRQVWAYDRPLPSMSTENMGD